MKTILVINAGSSSLKYQLIDIDTDVHTAVGTINTSIDPVAFMFGVGYRF